MINEQALKDRLHIIAKELDLPETITTIIDVINSGIKPILE